MVLIDVRADVSGARKRLINVHRDIMEKATVSAINKTSDKAKAEMVRAITEEYAISASEVRASLRVQKASRNRLIAILDPFASGKRKGRSMNLIHFVEKKTTMADARRRKSAGTLEQLHFKVKRVGGKQVINGAFIGNRGRTVFVREGKSRLPIKALSTVGVAAMFNTKRINERVVAKIRQEFIVELDRAIRFWANKQ